MLDERFPNGINGFNHLDSLAVHNPALLEKCLSCSRLRGLLEQGIPAAVAFMPKVLELGIDNLSFSEHGRNRLAILCEKGACSFFIKAIQTQSEGEVAKVAESIGIGPAQFESLPGFITENKLEGLNILELPESLRTQENFLTIGRNLAITLRKLHSNDWAFNDTIVIDDLAHSHMIIGEDLSVKLCDYGNAEALNQGFISELAQKD